MTPTKIVLISGHDLGRSALQGILESEEFLNGSLEITRIFSLHPRNSSAVCGYFDFSNYTDIPVTWFDRVTDDHVVEFLDTVEHHYLLVIGLSSLVPKHLLDAPRRHCGGITPYSEHYGVIGMHPTLLPVGRGRAPLPWTIIKQISTTGVSMYHLVEAADSGPLIEQVHIPVDAQENASTLFTKISQTHYGLGKILAEKMARRQVTSYPQDEERVTVWPRRTPKDSWIDFTNDAATIERQIRALTDPFPNAFFVYEGRRILVQAARLVAKNQTCVAGTILDVTPDNEPTIATGTGTGAIQLTRVSIEAGVSAPRFQAGHIIWGGRT